MNTPSPPPTPAAPALAQWTKPIIAWSYSSITMFENCPRKWWAVKIKKISDINSANDRGDQEHKAFQHYLTKGMLPPQELRGYVPMLDRIKTAPGKLVVEQSLTLDNQFQPCAFRDWDRAWVRGAGDVFKFSQDETQISYFDWKSGRSFWPSDDQIELTALLAFQHFPTVQRLKGLLVYYKLGKTHPHFVDRADAPLLWNGWIGRVRALEEAIKADHFPPTPNPLCAYCPYAACQHNTNQKIPR